MVFFRNPRRTVPSDEKILVSPADGKVLHIVEVDDDYVGAGFRIDIFLSVFDVHVNRTPGSGTVEFVKYRGGKFFSAFKDKASSDNERNDIGIAGPWGKMRVAQIAGLVARRIVCHVNKSDEVAAGQLFGMIRFGSRTELTFSNNYRPCVSPGQHVKGGETVVGELIADA
jgi:phosphatidylserine decarboxylase